MLKNIKRSLKDLLGAEYMEAVKNVTLTDVVAAANTLQLHTTYFLKGGSQ